MRRRTTIKFVSKMEELEKDFEQLTGYTREERPGLFFQYAAAIHTEYNCRMQERILSEVLNLQALYIGPSGHISRN